MKIWGLAIITFLFAAVQLSCEIAEEKVIIDTVEPEIATPDSIAYFDSVNAPLSFHLF